MRTSIKAFAICLGLMLSSCVAYAADGGEEAVPDKKPAEVQSRTVNSLPARFFFSWPHLCDYDDNNRKDGVLFLVELRI